MSQIEVRNLQKKKRLDLRLLKKLASSVLKEKLVSEDREVSITLVDNAKIKQLNERFRGVRDFTDVLAFPLGGEFISTKNLLGEVIISVEAADKHARERGHSLEDELILLLIHGILHLLGYRDDDKREREVMQEEERKILSSLGMNAGIV